MKNNAMFQHIVRYVASVLIGLAIALVLVVMEGESPGRFLSVIWESSFSSTTAFMNLIRWTSPILLSALAYIIAARAGVFNCGVEGGVIVGALCAVAVGLTIPLTGVAGILVVSLAAAVGGLIYQSIPAILFVRFRVNEVVTTLMMNYIAVLLCNFVVREFLLARSADGVESITVTSAPIDAGLRYSRLVPASSSNLSVLVVLALVVTFAIYLMRSKGGYSISAIGGSPRFARYIGVRARRTVLVAFLISGALGGLVGGLEVQGVLGQYIDGAFTNFGWNGLLCGLIALNSPIGIVPAALFLGILENAKLSIAQFTSVSPYMIQFLAALFILIFAIDPLRKLITERRRTVAEQPATTSSFDNVAPSTDEESSK